MDKGIATIDESHNQLLKEIYKKNIPMIGLSFGSPYLPDYGYFDSYLCTYGYGSISFNAATNALFGRKDISAECGTVPNHETNECPSKSAGICPTQTKNEALDMALTFTKKQLDRFYYLFENTDIWWVHIIWRIEQNIF